MKKKRRIKAPTLSNEGSIKTKESTTTLIFLMRINLKTLIILKDLIIVAIVTTLTPGKKNLIIIAISVPITIPKSNLYSNKN
jgi:hypothetical protein